MDLPSKKQVKFREISLQWNKKCKSQGKNVSLDLGFGWDTYYNDPVSLTTAEKEGPNP